MADKVSPLCQPLLPARVRGLPPGDETKNKVETDDLSEGKTPLGDTQKANINGVVYDLSTINLSDKQLEAIQLGCRLGFEITPEQVNENCSLSVLYSALEQKLTSQAEAPPLLHLMLERVGYSTQGLNLPPAPTIDKNSCTEYRKLDMFLTLGNMVMSMSDKQYRKFKCLHLKQRGCILCLKQPGALHDYHSDRIETRSQLIKLLHDRNQFNTNDVSIVFDWLEESGCSSCGKGLEEYCRRQEIKTRKQVEKCLLCTDFIMVMLSTISAVALVSILYVTLTSYTDVNISDPRNTSHMIGLNTTILLGCYDPQITDQVDISNLDIIDSAVVYKTREDRINVYNKTLTNISIFNSSIYFYSPVPVSYFDPQEPIYTAKDGGFMTYSIRLINRNVTRPTCAMRMVVLKSEQDYLSYIKVTRDPNDPLPPGYYAKACVADNGTYSFTFQLEPNSFYYFVVAIVENVIINVTASGSLSVYSHPASDQDNHCTLSTSDPNPCPIDINDRRSRENDNQVCIFGESRCGQEGKVGLYITFMSKRVYSGKYWGSSIAVGVITIIILIVLLVTVSICICHVVKRKKRIRKAARGVTMLLNSQ